MRFAVIIEHLQDKEKIAAVGPAQCIYLRILLKSERLCAAGPLSDNAGALWICEEETAAEAEQIIDNDPSTVAGVFKSSQIYSLAYLPTKSYKAEIEQKS